VKSSHWKSCNRLTSSAQLSGFVG